MKKANYRIKQDAENKPLYIQLYCPYCYTENQFIYAELEKDYGADPHWLKNKKIACQTCQTEMKFGDY